MNLRAFVSPHRAARIFALFNIAFLAVDILLAHRENAFAKPAEWVPVVFSAMATLLLVPGALGSDRPWVVLCERLVGWGSIAVGLVGMVFHLESAFFEEQTLRNLVYSAPFIAPVSYAGVGLLIILLRSGDPAVRPDGPSFGPWLVVLALFGFAGNFALSVLDHAQNGFFRPSEWIPVASSALAISTLVVTLAQPNRSNIRLAFFVMGLQVVVGTLGFVLHSLASLSGSAASFIDRFVYGAPAFAPMLFADVALLAAIGLWVMARRAPATNGKETLAEQPVG
ncbi:hypothetical protein AKJ09_07041 [Labilithrix luteola]|uniref:Uncharacterized protein n=1 Tax=Labilithrix luteola TaxID=1391654 RepID=A0A0K1Q3Q0_9BACT|nr:hypothetical protein [Labilithrix luteola]AKV00378.1 hypothetical protein AKJ09_07041 [Labilithrix luteola]